MCLTQEVRFPAKMKNSVDEILQKKDKIKGILEANTKTLKEQAELNSEVILRFT